jgi:hypothetical protein
MCCGVAEFECPFSATPVLEESVLSIGLGLILYHVLAAGLSLMFVLFFIVPFLFNLVDGRGWWYHAKSVAGMLGSFFRLGTQKRY